MTTRRQAARPAPAASPVLDEVTELDASFYDEVDESESTTDHEYDAWWAERQKARPTTPIKGIDVPIPSQIPAEIMLNPHKAMELSVNDADEIRRLLVLMLDLTGIDGDATLDAWLAEGMGSEELLIVFTWALLNGMRPPGKPAVSFARVARRLDELQAQGKAEPANRQERRAAGRKTADRRTGRASARRTAGSR